MHQFDPRSHLTSDIVDIPGAQPDLCSSFGQSGGQSQTKWSRAHHGHRHPLYLHTGPVQHAGVGVHASEHPGRLDHTCYRQILEQTDTDPTDDDSDVVHVNDTNCGDVVTASASSHTTSSVFYNIQTHIAITRKPETIGKISFVLHTWYYITDIRLRNRCLVLSDCGLIWFFRSF